MTETRSTKTRATEAKAAGKSTILIPILSAIGGAILLLRAVLPAEAAPAPCKGFSASLAQTHCSVVAKGGM